MTEVPSSVLALDVGDKRVGLAIASLVARLPHPLTTLERSEAFWAQLKKIIEEEGVGHIIVGLPRSLNSDSTAQTAATETFAEQLKENFKDLPLYFQDEALTSEAAETELKSRGKPYERGDIDALAANYILSDWLEEHKEIGS